MQEIFKEIINIYYNKDKKTLNDVKKELKPLLKQIKENIDKHNLKKFKYFHYLNSYSQDEIDFINIVLNKLF